MDPLTIIGGAMIATALVSFVVGLPLAMADNPERRRSGR